MANGFQWDGLKLLQANNNQTIANAWIRGYTRTDTALLSCRVEISSRYEQTSDTTVLLDTVYKLGEKSTAEVNEHDHTMMVSDRLSGITATESTLKPWSSTSTIFSA